jgi:hypothetical protein
MWVEVKGRKQGTMHCSASIGGRERKNLLTKSRAPSAAATFAFCFDDPTP